MSVLLDHTIAFAVQGWQLKHRGVLSVFLYGNDKLYFHLLRCIGVSAQYAHHLTQPSFIPQLTDADVQRFPLFVAAIMGKKIRKFVHGETDLNERDNAGFTPLHYAVAFGNARTMEALIAAGASIGAVDSAVRIPMTLWDTVERTGNRAVFDALGRAIESAQQRNADEWEGILHDSVYFTCMPIETHRLIASFIPLPSADYAGINLADFRAYMATRKW